jgi:predicted nuclease with TOPRIM domain
MSGHEDFKNLKEQHEKVLSLRERIERLRSSMESGNRQLKAAPAKTASTDRLSENIAELVDLEAALSDEVLELEADISIVEGIIQTIPKSEQRRIMRFRYIDNLPWKDVAGKADYSLDHCFSLHRQAKKFLAK